MRPQALLELLGRLLGEHRARGLGPELAIVPAILVGDFDEVDEADSPVQRLLAAFARYADAAYADAGAAATVDEPNLAENVVLRAALTSALTIERPSGVQTLKFHNGDVLLGTTNVDVASDGERELIGLARCLLDRRWERHGLGILTYTERNMDKPSVRASWDAVTAALAAPSVRVGTLRTLLVLVRTPQLFYDVHLAGEPSAHFVLDSERLVARSTETHARSIAKDLAQTAGPLVLHLGAGFSASSNLPLGNELRDDALRRRYEALPDAPIRSLAVRLYRDGQRDGRLTLSEGQAGEVAFAGQLTLEQVVRLESTMYSGTPQTLVDFESRHARAIPGAAVRALSRVVGRLPGLVLVTVNFDELVERAAGDSVRAFTSDREFVEFPAYLDRYMAGDETAVPMLKLHGTISDPASCVVSAEQTEAGLPRHKREALRAIAALSSETPVPWVYIGASLRDVDLVPVLDDDLFRDHTEEGWVTPLRDASVELFVQQFRLRSWQSKDRPSLEERTISTSADRFIEALADYVTPRDIESLASD